MKSCHNAPLSALAAFGSEQTQFFRSCRRLLLLDSASSLGLVISLSQHQISKETQWLGKSHMLKISLICIEKHRFYSRPFSFLTCFAHYTKHLSFFVKNKLSKNRLITTPSYNKLPPTLKIKRTFDL